MGNHPSGREIHDKERELSSDSEERGDFYDRLSDLHRNRGDLSGDEIEELHTKQTIWDSFTHTDDDEEEDYDSSSSGTSSSSDDCFIATAVYGDKNAPEVQVLRDFRDNVLMENKLGRIVIDLYYSGFGKRTADFIKNHVPSIIPLTRKGLDYLVRRYSSQTK